MWINNSELDRCVLIGSYRRESRACYPTLNGAGRRETTAGAKGKVAAAKPSNTSPPDKFIDYSPEVILAPNTYSVLLPRISKALVLLLRSEVGISSVFAAGARRSTVDACTVRTNHFVVRWVEVVTVGVVKDRKLNRRIAGSIGSRRDLHPNISPARELCCQFESPSGG